MDGVFVSLVMNGWTFLIKFLYKIKLNTVEIGGYSTKTNLKKN